MLIGGNGPGAEERVLALGDGWLPQSGPLGSVEELAGRIAGLRAKAADRGREPVPVTLFGAIPDAAMVGALADAGVDRCLFTVRHEPGIVESLGQLSRLLPGRGAASQ